MSCHKKLYAVLVYGILLVQCLAIYLPERVDNQLNVESHMQLQQHAEHKHAINQRIHHKSYDFGLDKNDDDTTANNLHRTEGADRKKRELSEWLIAPNTYWCGKGNLANGTYNSLGGANAADKCCRKHDHCQIYIPAMSTRYDLFNYSIATLSHCNCDRRFHTCLKMANDDDAKTIGKLFFNMMRTQCFVLRAEKVCLQRAADGSCEREIVKQKAYLKNNRKF